MYYLYILHNIRILCIYILYNTYILYNIYTYTKCHRVYKKQFNLQNVEKYCKKLPEKSCIEL